MLKIALLFAVVAVLVEGQILGLGPCPAVNVVKNFDATKYMGKWYEQMKYFATFEAAGKCITAEYALNGTKVNVVNKMRNIVTDVESSIIGSAVFRGNATDAKLSVTFPGSFFAGPYDVLATDYTNYAVVYSCVDIFFINIKFAWVLTRQRFPSAATLDTAKAVFDANKLDKTGLNSTEQFWCPLLH